MTDPSRRAYEEWKEADAAARDAEQQLATAWEAFFARSAHAPEHTLIREVSRRRAVANDRLSHAMSAINASRTSDATVPGIHPGMFKEKGPREAGAK